MKTVTLKRLTEHTFGILSSDGADIAVTLEHPWRDNAANVSRIPAGTYPLFLRPNAETRHDYDVWELKDVPGRTNVQIHIGNTLADTDGCILIGSARASKSPPTISGSKLAYAKWMAEMRDAHEAQLVVFDPPVAPHAP